MNGVALSSKNAKDEKAIDEFVMAVNKMNQNIDIVERHRKTMAKKQMKLLQMTEDAPAIDLIFKSNIVELCELKEEAFFELLASFGRKD